MQSIHWLKSKIVSWSRDQVSFPCLTWDDLIVRGYVVPMHVLRKADSIGTPFNWSRATRNERMEAEHVQWDAIRPFSPSEVIHGATFYVSYALWPITNRPLLPVLFQLRAMLRTGVTVVQVARQWTTKVDRK